MSTHSTDGREWAKLSVLKPGDKVKVDSGFTCMNDDAELEVYDGGKGELMVLCREGGHGLEGQLSDVDYDHLVGMWPA